MPISRRALLGLMAGSTYVLAANPRSIAATAAQATKSHAQFPQGVASADPQPDAVMLWTRAIPGDNTDAVVSLVVELSADQQFSDIVLSSPVECDASSDYTVRVYVSELQADTIYYYRFRGAPGSMSRVGRTRTAPAAGAERHANIAFTSCQSYEQAFYGVWARMVEEDKASDPADQIDFVLHLGDFIYERSWHTLIDGSSLSRKLPDFPDGVMTDQNRHAVSLSDYRHLYKTYLTDPHLQEARARWPFVCTWDDHEYSNDNFQSYSTYAGQYHLNPQRKQWANQAWFEFIPSVLDELPNQPAHDFRTQSLAGSDAAANRAAVDSLCIYRQLRWGKHLDIVLTDTRSYRSAPCLPDGFAETLGLPLNSQRLVDIADGGRAYNGGNPPATLPYGNGDTPNPARNREPGSLLGATQRQWFIDTLAQSQATWKLWGNSLPLIPMRLDLSSLPFNDFEDSVLNTDTWSGFPHEQRLVMDALAEKGISGVVSLSGDHHLHGAGTVNRSPAEPDSPAVIADFSVTGVSSAPVFGDLVVTARKSHEAFSSLVFKELDDGELQPVWHMSLLDGVLASSVYARTSFKTSSRWLGPNKANPGLKFVDTTCNGYGMAKFDAGSLSVALVGMQDCRQPADAAPQVAYTAHFHLPRWQPGEQPSLQGPEFTGQAPFPFG